MHAETTDRSPPSAPAAPALDRLTEAALKEGLRHAAEAGGRFQPFLLTGGGALDYLFDGGGHSHPVELAVRLMLSGARAADASRLALVMPTRLTTPRRVQSDAVLVLACARDGRPGEVWAQAYQPRRWYRDFTTDPSPWLVGPALNLFQEARGEVPVALSIAGIPA